MQARARRALRPRRDRRRELPFRRHRRHGESQLCAWRRVRNAQREARRPAVAEAVAVRLSVELDAHVERRDDRLRLRERRARNRHVQIRSGAAQLQPPTRLVERAAPSFGESCPTSTGPARRSTFSPRTTSASPSRSTDTRSGNGATRGGRAQRRAGSECLRPRREAGPEDRVVTQAGLGIGPGRRLDIGDRPRHREAVVAELVQREPLDDAIDTGLPVESMPTSTRWSLVMPAGTAPRPARSHAASGGPGVSNVRTDGSRIGVPAAARPAPRHARARRGRSAAGRAAPVTSSA